MAARSGPGGLAPEHRLGWNHRSPPEFHTIVRAEGLLSLIRIKQTTHGTRCNAARGLSVAAQLGRVEYVHDPTSHFDHSDRGQIMQNARKMLLRQIEL